METLLTDRLATLSHPQRMALFRLLMRRYPDQLSAGEISSVLALKASTTSVYLSALKTSGLITQQRDGTHLRYAVDLPAARAVVSDLFLDCCKGRADLCPPVSEFQPKVLSVDKKLNVLFICTGNSARSIIAETLLRDIAGDRFNVYSAGTLPRSELNLIATAMLAEKGHDTSDLTAKNVSVFQTADAPVMDFVFTVCDLAANEECPPWPGQPISGHWGMPDPVKATGTLAERRLAFQQTYGALRNRMTAFTALPLDQLDRASLQHRIDDIAKETETGIQTT